MFKLSLEDIMFEHPITVKESIGVGKVSHLLMRYRINGILVVKDASPGQLIGIFTTTDLFRMIDEALSHGAHRIKELKKISRIPVGRVATRNIISLQKGDNITKAIALMHKKDIHTIPVYDKGNLVGVVGRHDILNIALNYY